MIQMLDATAKDMFHSFIHQGFYPDTLPLGEIAIVISKFRKQILHVLVKRTFGILCAKMVTLCLNMLKLFWVKV